MINNLNDNILNKMKQAIGFSEGRVNNGIFKMYRNDAMCYDADKDWKYLISLGYAMPTITNDSYFHYSITDKGVKYLEKTLKITIVKWLV